MSKIKIMVWDEIEDGTLEDLINEMGQNFAEFTQKQTQLLNRIKERAQDGRN